jgi:hypothetical protein
MAGSLSRAGGPVGYPKGGHDRPFVEAMHARRAPLAVRADRGRALWRGPDGHGGVIDNQLAESKASEVRHDWSELHGRELLVDSLGPVAPFASNSARLTPSSSPEVSKSHFTPGSYKD